jgi:hypothetical protein
VAAGKRSTGGGTMAGTDESRFSVSAFHVPTFHSNFPKFHFFVKTKIEPQFLSDGECGDLLRFSDTKSPRWDLWKLTELKKSKHQVGRALLMQLAFSGSSLKGVSQSLFIFKSFNPAEGRIFENSRRGAKWPLFFDKTTFSVSASVTRPTAARSTLPTAC